MRFADKSTPPPFLNSRDQWRLLGLVATLLIVLVAMRIASKPQTWTWLFPKQDAPRSEPDGNTSSKPLGFRVNLDEGDELPADGFRLEPQSPPGEPPDPAALSRSSQPPPGEQAGSRNGTDPSGGDPAAQTMVDEIVLAPVTDNTLGIRRSEADAYYAVLAHARDASEIDVGRTAFRGDSFNLLMTEPDRFRGKLVAIDGELKRLAALEVDRNDAGIENLFEAWILTPDSGDNLFHVVCTEIAEGLPLGEEFPQSPGVQVTGFFFKKEGYAARRGLHTAPLLLAKRLRRRPLAAAAQMEFELAPYLIGIAVVVSLSIGVTLLYFAAGDRRARGKRWKRMLEPSEDAASFLTGVVSENPLEYLRDLSDASTGKQDDAPQQDGGAKTGSESGPETGE